MNKLTVMIKSALVVSTLATALAGCCLFGNDRCCETKSCGRKTSGVNTSMTVGVGTDGISLGSESNVGSHGASASVSTH